MKNAHKIMTTTTQNSDKKTLKKNSKRVWEQAPSSNNTMIKLDPNVYAREAMVPDWKMILSYEDDLVQELNRKRLLKLYDVKVCRMSLKS